MIHQSPGLLKNVISRICLVVNSVAIDKKLSGVDSDLETIFCPFFINLVYFVLGHGYIIESVMLTQDQAIYHYPNQYDHMESIVVLLVL